MSSYIGIGGYNINYIFGPILQIINVNRSILHIVKMFKSS